MLFTTAIFVAVFLPITLAGFFLIARASHSAAATWLFACSVAFYGYWMPEFTLLLLGSITGNYLIGTRIGRTVAAGGEAARGAARRWMIGGVAANLLLLAYFKYAGFFVANLNAATGLSIDIGQVILPIGISFFTFTQIAFLADAYQKGVREYKFSHYGLFVTYFPHLIAGPVLHHAQMMPQFGEAQTYRFNWANFTAGAAIFALGLVKKVVLADGVSPYADAVFRAADAGLSITSAEAWLGAIAYTLQLYFDFSGYSDMAIGLSWMFNVRLPYNFDSPYKATNIVDFWRRWHMTLSQFLRDYLYIALGGNRLGPIRRYANLFITMLLGGLWHGASWTFVFWGALHGAYLMANHAWRGVLGEVRWTRLSEQRAYRLFAWALTFLAVVVAWVFFRAVTFDGARAILAGMCFVPSGGPTEVPNPNLWNAGLSLLEGVVWCAVLGAIAALAPNSNRIGEAILMHTRAAGPRASFAGGAAAAAVIFLVVLNAARDSVSAFIYFNF